MNPRLCESKGFGTGDGSGAVTLGAVNAPASKILLAESNAAFPDVVYPSVDRNYIGGIGGGPAPNYVTEGLPSLFAGHTDQFNLAFCDGHVKSMRPTQTLSPFVAGAQAAGQFNMWGGMGNSTNNSAGLVANPAGVCADISINCDLSEQAIFQGMQDLEAHYK